MMIIMMIMVLTSINFMFMKHPLSMGLILLMQTSMLSITTGMLSNKPWFSYILFLIMVGGMLVLFIYMTSIASNEKFKTSVPMVISTLTMSLAMLAWIWFNDPMQINFNPSKMVLNSNLSLNKYLNYPSIFIFSVMIIYLFIALEAVVKISNIKHGPLRQNT